MPRTREQLAAEYLALVGYDPFIDSPSITEEEVAQTLEEYKAEVAIEEAQVETVEVMGAAIQIDRSGGQGHCWVDATADECPASTQEEIAAEIIDGGSESHGNFVATNGQHYRW